MTVTDGAQKIRAYNLVTTPSAMTGTALLSKVETYGSDFTVASGVVSAGSKLPDVAFEYSTDQYTLDTRTFTGKEFHEKNGIREIGYVGRDYLSFKQYDKYWTQIVHQNGSDNEVQTLYHS